VHGGDHPDGAKMTDRETSNNPGLFDHPIGKGSSEVAYDAEHVGCNSLLAATTPQAKTAAVTSRLQFPCSIGVGCCSGPFSGVHEPGRPERPSVAVRQRISVYWSAQSRSGDTPSPRFVMDGVGGSNPSCGTKHFA